MTSTPTTRFRLDKQAPGDNPDAWGERLNAALDMIDETGGFAEITVDGNKNLTVANFSSDQARRLVLRFVGPGGFAVTIPAVEKMYYIDNRCAADVVLKTASTNGATVIAGSKRIAYCDGATVTTDTSGGIGSASTIAFDPTDLITSTNVQDAIEEVYADAFQALQDRLSLAIGGTLLGNLQIQKADAALRLHYPGKKIWEINVRENGWLYFPENGDTPAYNFAILPGGDVYSAAFGKLTEILASKQAKITTDVTTDARRLKIDSTYQVAATVTVTLDINGDAYITFPWAFPNNCFCVLPLDGDGSITPGFQMSLTPRSLTKSGFIVRGESAGGPRAGLTFRVNYYAMGA